MDTELPVVVDGDGNVAVVEFPSHLVLSIRHVNTIKTKHLQRHLFIIFVFSVFLKAY